MTEPVRNTTAIADVDRALDALRRAIGVAVAQAHMPASGPTLGVLIRERRAELGLSLEAVAKAAGSAKGHVWELEQDRSRNPTVAMVYGLSIALALPFLTVAAAALMTVTAMEADRAA
jgi:DNA-binding XRE family transcriptional regulator